MVDTLREKVIKKIYDFAFRTCKGELVSSADLGDSILKLTEADKQKALQEQLSLIRAKGEAIEFSDMEIRNQHGLYEDSTFKGGFYKWLIQAQLQTVLEVLK
jgi:hypothetical protein